MNFHSFERFVHLESHAPDGIKAIYYNTAIRKLGLSVIGIFFPVFIFLETQRIYGASFAIGLYGIAGYYFVQQTTKLLFLIPSAKSIITLGYRRTLFLGTVLLLLLLLMLSFLEITPFILFVIAVIQGLETAFYWLSYHTLFASDGVSSDLGSEMGVTKLLERLMSIAGPALGGLMITTWGFHVVFSFAFLIILLSVIPFFFMESHKHNETFELKEVISWVRNRHHRNELFSTYGRFLDENVSGIILPIFMFIIAGSFSGQGLIVTISLVLGTISVYLSGYLFDKKHSRNLFLGGIVSTSLFTLLRGGVTSFSQLLVFDSLRKIASPYYWLTFDTLWYKKAKQHGESALVFAFIRMVMACLGMFTVLLVLVLFAHTEFRFWSLWILQVSGIMITSTLWKKGKRYE